MLCVVMVSAVAATTVVTAAASPIQRFDITWDGSVVGKGQINMETGRYTATVNVPKEYAGQYAKIKLTIQDGTTYDVDLQPVIVNRGGTAVTAALLGKELPEGFSVVSARVILSPT